MRRCCSSSAQRHGCTNCKKRSLCSVFCKTFAYHLCAVKRLTALFLFVLKKFAVPTLSKKAQRRRKCRFCAFLLTEEKLLYGITPPPPKKSTSALAREKLSFHSVFHGLLDYRFFSVMRSSLRSERKRSKPLLERSGRFRASF